MLHNSISADMKVCALQLKQKSTAGVPSGILRNFRAATFGNNLTLAVFGFHFFGGSYLLSHKKAMFFLHKFFNSGAFPFGLRYRFLYT